MGNQGPDKKALAVLGIAVVLLLAYVCMGVAEGAHAVEPMECSDEYMPPAITAPDKAAAFTAKLVDEARERAQEVEEAADYVETEYEYQEADYAAYSGSGGTYYAEYNELYNDNGPTREMPGWHDGYLETYYSSNVLYHSRTSEWTADEEGFYRDDQGRYIVGVDIAEGIEIGTEVETGKGTGVVMDYGSGAHVHDFYTNW